MKFLLIPALVLALVACNNTPNPNPGSNPGSNQGPNPNPSPDQKAVVQGKLISVFGTPISGAKVMLEGNTDAKVTTDADGAFKLEGASVPYTLIAAVVPEGGGVSDSVVMVYEDLTNLEPSLQLVNAPTRSEAGLNVAVPAGACQVGRQDKGVVYFESERFSSATIPSTCDFGSGFGATATTRLKPTLDFLEAQGILHTLTFLKSQSDQPTDFLGFGSTKSVTLQPGDQDIQTPLQAVTTNSFTFNPPSNVTDDELGLGVLLNFAPLNAKTLFNQHQLLRPLNTPGSKSVKYPNVDPNTPTFVTLLSETQNLRGDETLSYKQIPVSTALANSSQTLSMPTSNLELNTPAQDAAVNLREPFTVNADGAATDLKQFFFELDGPNADDVFVVISTTKSTVALPDLQAILGIEQLVFKDGEWGVTRYHDISPDDASSFDGKGLVLELLTIPRLEASITRTNAREFSVVNP